MNAVFLIHNANMLQTIEMPGLGASRRASNASEEAPVDDTKTKETL